MALFLQAHFFIRASVINCSFISSDLSVAVWIICYFIMCVSLDRLCFSFFFLSFVWSDMDCTDWIGKIVEIMHLTIISSSDCVVCCFSNKYLIVISRNSLHQNVMAFSNIHWFIQVWKTFLCLSNFFCPLSVFVPCFPLLPITASESETSCSWLHIDKDTAGLGLHVANGSSFIYASLLVRQPSSGADGCSVQLDSAIEPFVIGTWNEVPH